MPALRVDRMLLPAFVSPQIPKPADRVPIGDAWVYELKYDGYRIIAATNRSEVRLYNRRGLDWTARFDAISAALGDLKLPGVLLDGEVCALDAKGRSSFSALRAGADKLVYVVFDLLAEHGKDLRPTVLLDRKDRLRQLVERAPKGAPLLYVGPAASDGERMFQNLCSLGCEGIVAKRADRPYLSGAGRDWIKVKCPAYERA
jgi:bifunctional non-homologous end joining protein LigD